VHITGARRGAFNHRPSPASYKRTTDHELTARQA
jgi:hypothetical protein